MSAFYDTTMGAESMTASQLDAIAVERNGLVGSHGFGYATNGSAPLAGGWTSRWIATGGMGNYGDLVLIPTDARTRAIWREGKIRFAMGFGLSHREAERILDARIRHAGEPAVLAVIGQMLACAGCVAAARSFDRYSSTRAWAADYAAVLPDFAGLSVPRTNAAVAAVLAAVAA